MDNICAAMNEELGVTIEAHLEIDTENWKEIDLFPVARKFVAQLSTRFTLGDSDLGRSFCCDPKYLQLCLETVDFLLVSAGVARSSPRVLRPLLGRLGGWPAHHKMQELKRCFRPVYEETMSMLQHQHQSTSTDHQHGPRNHMHIMLRFGLKERRDEASSLGAMTYRLSIANSGSMHQTSTQVVNMLLNILESDPEFNTMSVLRDEVARVMTGRDGQAGAASQGWSKAQLAAMVRADSAARGTLHLHGFLMRPLTRKIVADGGVTTENGTSTCRRAPWCRSRRK